MQIHQIFFEKLRFFTNGALPDFVGFIVSKVYIVQKKPSPENEALVRSMNDENFKKIEFIM